MELSRPHPRTRLAVSLYALAAAALPAAMTALLYRLPFLPHRATTALLCLFAAGLLWLLAGYLPLRYRRTRYHVGDTELITVSGVFLRTTRRMPLEAVRHVTVIRGPLERRWGYAFAVLSGAGGWLLLEGVDPLTLADLARRVTQRGQA